MADVITWEPRAGDTGDDRYHWPADDRRLDWGDCSAYPAQKYSPTIADVPTESMVKAGTAFGQVAAEINRRHTWAGNPYFSYPVRYSPNQRLTVTSRYLSDYRNYVDAIRTREFRTAYTWEAENAAANKPLTEAFHFEMRKALAYEEYDTPWILGGYWRPSDSGLLTWHGYPQIDGTFWGRVIGCTTENIFLLGSDYYLYRYCKADKTIYSTGVYHGRILSAYTSSSTFYGIASVGGNLYFQGCTTSDSSGTAVLFRSTDGGYTWSSVTLTIDGSPAKAISSYPFETPDGIILSVQGGYNMYYQSLYKSYDNGATWTLKYDNVDAIAKMSFWINQSTGELNSLCVARFAHKRYASKDYGNTWYTSAYVADLGEYGGDSPCYRVGNVLFLNHSYSTDWGLNWKALVYASCKMSSGELYSMYQSGVYTGIKYTSDGINWTDLGATNIPWNIFYYVITTQYQELWHPDRIFY